LKQAKDTKKKPIKKVTAKTSSKSTKKKGITFSQLRKLNFAVAALLLVQAVLVLVFSNSVHGTQPIVTNFSNQDKLASETAGHSVATSASHHLFDLNIAYLVAAFFLISTIAHLLLATWRRKTYEADINKGINRSRWIESIFSTGVMILAIAILAGVYDIASLLMLFALTAIMSLLGLSMELRNQNEQRVDWANYWIGVGAGLTPWIVLLIYIWSMQAYGNGVPAFIYWIFASLFVLFASFAINMYLQYKKLGHWSTYLYGERTYIILGFIAKTALAWQIFAGTLR
jgi:hypothetical protein